MKLVRQPPGSNLCGQAVVAMLLNITLEESIKLIGTRGRTKWEHLATVLILKGFIVAGALTRYKEKSWLPDKCVLRVRWKAKNKTHYHLVIKFGNLIFDPNASKKVPWGKFNDFMWRWDMKISSFVNIR